MRQSNTNNIWCEVASKLHQPYAAIEIANSAISKQAIACEKSAFYLNIPKLDIQPNPPAMPRIPECDRCLLFARNPHLICAVHPAGPNTDTCLDFREDPNTASEELWEPEGASYYNGELILQPPQRWTLEEQLELLDTHPLFTGRCPQCERPFPKYETPPVHWDCSECGWMDDAV